MTLNEIASKIMTRLNLTSTEAATRVKDEVNEVYRELVSSMGMDTSIRGEVTATSVAGSRYITFGGPNEEDDKVLKLLAVYLPEDTNPNPGILSSVTFDELRHVAPGTWPPSRYAISAMGPTEVTIFTDVEGDDTSEICADCLLASDTMGDEDSPFFTENFHDILVHGVMAIELDKMEKGDRAAKAQAKYDQRAGELKLFIAKDAYIQIHQGRTSRWGVAR